MDAIESIRDGFALFDAEDRLITNNSAFGKSIGLPSELLRSGITFEDLVRDMVDTGVVPGVQGREEAWIADRLRRHLDPSDEAEVYEFDGRHTRITERKTSDGGTVAIHTDVTALHRKETAPESTVVDLGRPRRGRRLTTEK